ncbi:DUF1329 domain-containing protein, partial [Pseudomonas citronellolis]
TAWVSPRLNRMGFAKAQPILRKAPRRSRQDCDQRFPSASTYTTPRPSAGARHVYARRHFLIDEDSRAIAKVDQYDNRCELRRV